MTSIYLQYKGQMLLLYRQGSRVVNNVWVGSAGGHFEENELNDARACVLRELQEELGITAEKLQNLELRYITLRRTQDEIRQNYYFFAELSQELSLTSNEGAAQWFSLEELSELPMPFSAKFMLEHYVQVGRHNHNIYVGAADGAKVVFTELPAF